ncbi:unnamed protein product [Schistosoma curassoni]|nr:unnamed protein product [Schistosoma curassoni]
MYLLTYFRLLHLMEEHRLSTSIFHRTLSCAILFSCFQLLFILFMTISKSQRNVFVILPLFVFSSRFQLKA